MKTLATEAEVDSQGWLNIHTPAPPGTAAGKLEVLVVWSPPGPTSIPPLQRRVGSLPGKVTLAADFHAPLEDFQPYSE